MERRRSFVGIRAVFFDLYNTLARFWPPREEVQAHAAATVGLQVSPEGIARGYAQADAYLTRENARWPLRLRPPEEVDKFWAEYERLILAGAGVQVDAETALKVWRAVRALPYDLALFPDVLPGLRLLRERGLVLGVLSNINRDGPALLNGLGLAGAVDFLVTSREVGVEKPHPRIFQEALRRAGVQPHEALHVGDQVESDVVGAQGVGIHPVLMDRYGHLVAPEGVPVVRSVAEVAELLADKGV
ncbi:MAG: HAD-IA family hydrolase [Dehalococcoidia bacterium]|nr:HAD-IA family hydrolase [Dehalococcoidia bacterium]MDW8120025.1 HAD-IA family hydrolase [Chloroflexota bacterium]